MDEAQNSKRLDQIETDTFRVRDFVNLKIWHMAPAKAKPGQCFLADGTDWNPTGGGFGLYTRDESNTWQKL